MRDRRSVLVVCGRRAFLALRRGQRDWDYVGISSSGLVGWLNLNLTVAQRESAVMRGRGFDPRWSGFSRLCGSLDPLGTVNNELTFEGTEVINPNQRSAQSRFFKWREGV